MPEIISDNLWDAGRILFLSGIVVFAYRQANKAGEKNGRWIALRDGVAWCLGIALFAAVTMGSPSCEEAGDPLRGGCAEYADDGYEPSLNQQIAQFLFWSVLLTIPVIFGALDARRLDAHPWRRPRGNSGDGPGAS